jgi:prophage antirepressor-like protein
MKLVTFELEAIAGSLPAIQFENGEWYFAAKAVCEFADVSNSANAANWVRSNVPGKWTKEIKMPGKAGRPALYLSRPGFYFAICQGSSEKAHQFRDEVFEVILPKIAADGGYIQSSISDAQAGRLQENLDKANPQAAWIRDAARLEELESYHAMYGKVLTMLSKISMRAESVNARSSLVKYIDSWGKDYAEGQKAAEKAVQAFIGTMLNKYEKIPTLFKPQKLKFLKASEMTEKSFSRIFPWEKEYH